jgi:DNA segregation ATPase FtsK/SpoIIIE, S-DNA-T family
VGPSRPLADQLKWLPHTRTLTSPLAGSHVVNDPRSTQALCTELVAVARRRTDGIDRDTDRHWPWLLVVLDEMLEPDPALVAQLLDRSSDAGIAVVWVARSAARVPRQAAAMLNCVPHTLGPSELWFRDPRSPETQLELEPVHPNVTDRVVRAHAPLRDASAANATTAIPRLVPLFTALGLEDATRMDDVERADRHAGGDPVERIISKVTHRLVERWLNAAGPSLEAPLGVKADGVMNLDLFAEGPHALIGGTSGSGKSELLVALVAGLIATFSPQRLNLLFVDYKGGAASAVFKEAPHTVGYVTNLTGDLANRALVSLRGGVEPAYGATRGALQGRRGDARGGDGQGPTQLGDRGR